MKRITVLFVIMLMCGSVFGTMMQDSILVVEYTNVAPVIDGELDDVWRNITAIPTERWWTTTPIGMLFLGGPMSTSPCV